MTEITTAVTPSKDPHGSRSIRSKTREKSKISENFNPNSAKSRKSTRKKQNSVAKLPQNGIKDRKFVVAKKVSKKEKNLSLAYENLRASQELSKNESENNDGSGNVCDGVEEESEGKLMVQDCEEGDESVRGGISFVKRRRERLMEEARKSLPESGCGRVLHLVKAFENLLSLPKGLEKEGEEGREEMDKWALPGLHPPEESELVLTSEKLGLGTDASVSSSLDGSVSRISNGGRRSRRNSTESTDTMGGRLKKKQLRVTPQQPFKLRTEQRGKSKEEEFLNKLREMMAEEDRLRIPVAQGLPVTTEEPELLIKPPVKESTLPLDLRLYTDLRAVDRADFDHQITEKMKLIEQYKREREIQKKLEEEEEVRRLRKELVPKAQPMPYFDKPFIPTRCTKHPTKPRDPKFHLHEHKKIKCGLSLDGNKSCV